MKVCIYARVGNQDSFILTLQIKALENYVAAHGHTVTSVVSDLGISGTENVESLKSIINMAKEDVFDAVIAMSSSRFSRDIFTYMEFAETLKAYGKTIHYASYSEDIRNVIPISLDAIKEANLL